MKNMHSKVHAIAFDLVGVFFDFLDVDLTPRQQEIRHIFGRFVTDEEHLDFYLKKYPIPREEIIEEIRFICDHAYKIREPDLFEKLPPLKFAAASNHLSYAMDWLKRQPVAKHFQVLLASGSLGLAKPDPRYFMTLCEALEERPENVLFIDDTLGHVVSAQACGLQTLHFVPGKVLSEEIIRYLKANE